MKGYDSGYRQGKIDLLIYLIKVAQNTKGASVWLALFDEIFIRLRNKRVKE